MLPQQYIDQVKQATDMVKLAKRYTELKLSGEGIYVGVCPHPDHKDDTPSFIVWEKDQSWACMGCHQGKKNTNAKKHTLAKNYGSDCIAFMQWVERLNLREAVLKLANLAGLPKPDMANQKLYDSKKLLAKAYQASLHNQPFNYLISRGLDRKDMQDWMLGFDGKKITFPLLDRYNNVLGFTKRWLDMPEDQDDKYRNSSNSKIFNKGFYLYGIHKVDWDFEEIRITEGPMDVIIPEKYGVKNIVATLGTAFTEGHADIIKNLGMIPLFCMDGDPAGLKAINKAITMLAKKGVYSKILILPDGMDMCDLANEYKENTEQYIQDNSVTYGIYKMQYLLNMYDSKMNELKLKLYPDILEVLEEIPFENEKVIIKSLLKMRMGIEL